MYLMLGWIEGTAEGVVEGIAEGLSHDQHSTAQHSSKGGATSWMG